MRKQNRFIQKFTRLQQKIVSLLEARHSLLDNVADQTQENFMINTEIDELVSSLQALNKTDEELVLKLITLLAHYYHGGIVLGQTQEGWQPEAFFVDGLLYHYNLDRRPQIQLPQITSSEVLKNKNKTLLHQLGLESVERHGAEIFLLRPVADLSFILVIELGSPWLPDYLEKTLKALCEVLQD